MKNAVLILICLALAPFCRARTITVDDDGPGDFNNIQAAIDDANDGDTVEVQPGRYTGPGNYRISFRGKAITVRSTDPSDPEVVGATVVDCNSIGTGFVFDGREDANSVLAGLSITNGWTWSSDHGGAITCEDSSPVINKCVIVGNYAYFHGGGIYINNSTGLTGTGEPLIRECTIARNSAGFGGGIRASTRGPLTIEHCIITENTAWQGGGIRKSYDGFLTIRHCIISGNKSLDTGGGLFGINGDTMMINCTISGNAAGNSGGGIYGIGDMRVIISESVLWDNTAPVGPDVALIRDDWGRSPALSASYCDIRTDSPAVYVDETCILTWGPGNIDTDPCFADPGYWDPNGTPEDANDDFWVNGDYHLKSQAGRYDPNRQTWIIDDVTSPCIDAGDPMTPISYEPFPSGRGIKMGACADAMTPIVQEPFPNGGIVNMGAYGGTVEASKSYFGKPVCEVIVAGDINGDCIVDFRDFLFIGLHWMEDNN